MSIPLAIALLFFIINVYERSDKKSKVETNKQANSKDTLDLHKKEEVEKITTSSEPYKYFFGQAAIDKSSLQVIQVTNYSGADAVVCIVDAVTNKVVRHYYIANNFFLYFEYLPAGKYYIKNYLGDNFNAEKKVAGTDALGAFESEKQFQAFKQNPFEIKLEKHDTLFFDVLYFKNNKSNSVINSQDFFVR